MFVWGGLTNSCEKNKSERQRRKGKILIGMQSSRRARRNKKAFLSDRCKEIEENNRMGKTRDLFKKIRDTKRTRSLGEGKGYSLQYSGLENSMECIVHGFAESDTTKRLSLSLSETMWDIMEDVNFISKDPEFWNASPKGTQWKGLESLSFTSESSDLVPGMFQTSFKTCLRLNIHQK